MRKTILFVLLCVSTYLFAWVYEDSESRVTFTLPDNYSLLEESPGNDNYRVSFQANDIAISLFHYVDQDVTRDTYSDTSYFALDRIPNVQLVEQQVFPFYANIYECEQEYVKLYSLIQDDEVIILMAGTQNLKLYEETDKIVENLVWTHKGSQSREIQEDNDVSFDDVRKAFYERRRERNASALPLIIYTIFAIACVTFIRTFWSLRRLLSVAIAVVFVGGSILWGYLSQDWVMIGIGAGLAIFLEIGLVLYEHYKRSKGIADDE